LKLDTNGYYPEMLSKALSYVDLVSVDIKAPLGEAYAEAAGLGEGYVVAVERIRQSLSVVRAHAKLSEARTTVVPGITDSEEAIDAIASTVKEYRFSSYTLQQFRPMNTLDLEYLKKKSPTHSLMFGLGRRAKKVLPDAVVRISTQLKGFEVISSEV